MRSRTGDKAFLKARDRLIEQAIRDPNLTAAQCLTVIGAAAFVEPDTWECLYSQGDIATAVKIDRRSVIRARPVLIDAGYLIDAPVGAIVIKAPEQDDSAPVTSPVTTPVTTPVTEGVTTPVTCESQKARQIETSDANLLNLPNRQDLHNLPKDKNPSAPDAARQGQSARLSADGMKAAKIRIAFTREDWDRFHQLIGIIVDHSSGDRNHKSGAGIIAVSGGPGYSAGGEVGDEVYSYPYDWAELQKFASAGLLRREGGNYHITDAGWHFHDLYEQQLQREAA